jgi:hypothetical protein
VLPLAPLDDSPLAPDVLPLAPLDDSPLLPLDSPEVPLVPLLDSPLLDELCASAPLPIAVFWPAPVASELSPHAVLV